MTAPLKKHRCSYCYYSSDRAFDIEKHQARKHSDLISGGDGMNSCNENGTQCFKQVFSCGNCKFETLSLEEMTQHKRNDHNIINPDKGYSKKGAEDNDLETDEEDAEDGEIIQNIFENGYQLWDLCKTTEREDESRQEVTKEEVKTDRFKNRYQF